MARAPLVVIVGTGTGIGKTHFGAALVASWGRRGVAVAGVKPIESGGREDGETLERASTFHVKQYRAPYLLARPVSPHLAARMEDRTISMDEVVKWTEELRSRAGAVVLETAGGLFSPLGPKLSNADMAAALDPTATLLVAPDRLGVLHDVGAATRAAAAMSLSLRGVVLTPPAAPDLSTGTNAAELALVTPLPVLATVPRAPWESIDLGTVLDALGF